MISNSFIHSNDLCEEFIYESYHILNSIFDEMQRSYILETEMVESSLFSEFSDDVKPYYEEEQKNIFERIGQKLLDLGKSFVKMLAGIVDKIKGALGGTNKALKDENLKRAMKENPELANQFLKSVASGGIKYNDVADFNTLVDEATKITNDYMSGKMDDKSFSDKMDTSLKKFADKAAPIGAIIGVVSGGLGLIQSIQKITEKSAKTCDSARFNALKMAELEEKCLNDAKDTLRSNSGGKEIRNLQLVAEKHRNMMLATGKSYNAWAKLGDKILSGLSRIPIPVINKKLSSDVTKHQSTIAQDAAKKYGSGKYYPGNGSGNGSNNNP